MAAQSLIPSSISSAYNPILRPSKKRSIHVIRNATKPTKVLNNHMSLDLNTSDELISSKNDDGRIPITLQPCIPDSETAASAMAKLYAVWEAVADRVEMHANIGEQRNNWNSLLLNSINMITLTATTMAGLTAAQPVLALKLSSAMLFAAATGMLLVVNKLQPSQLVEEQRNATRLFKQLHEEIQTMLILRDCVTEIDVEKMMERVLALDKAYPLPLIGVMLEKFPAKLEAAVWWPPLELKGSNGGYDQEPYDEVGRNSRNGWSDEMEQEMKEIINVLRKKDKQDYLRLGNTALKLNKMLSVLGPVFTGVAAVGSALSDSSSSVGALAMAVAVGGGALSTIVNSIEHGGQVGMVVEMYRNCAGYFQIMEESIESAIGEEDIDSRENGQVMEMKVCLQLGRSLSQMKELAMASASSRQHGTAITDFASKLL